MERIVTNRLVYFLETRGYFVDYQNGFRIGRGTMDSVAVLDLEIRKAMANKEALVGVFLDIEKAYDSMWKEGVLIKLHDAGVKGRMLNWIKDFLMGRTIQVRVGGTYSETVNIENGTPQGSVISPVLFNVMINDIFKNVGQGFGRSLFADDGAIWRRGRNVEFLLKKTQEGLNVIEEWANRWSFKISVPKSKFMVFGYKRKIPRSGLSLYGAPLERVKEFKFLGMWLDERLTWKIHIGKIQSKCEKVINVLRSLAGSEWGAERGTMLMIYQAMIRSAIDYGSFVYGAAAKSTLDKLDATQARALRTCCGAFRTTPIPALLVEMGEWPLRIRRSKLGLHYWAKLNGTSLSLSAKCLLNETWEFAGGRKKGNFLSGAGELAKRVGLDTDVVGLIYAFWSVVPMWLLPEPIVDLTLLDRKQQDEITKTQVEAYLNNVWGSHMQIYTDGSKDPDNQKAGCGIYVVGPQVQQGLRVTNGASVFATEISAIIWALWWVEQVKPDRVVICSDSAAALVALRSRTSRARADLINEVLISLLRVEKVGCEVVFLWVPAHIGVEGNEAADKLAKNSLQRDNIDVEMPWGKPEFYSAIKEGLEKQWQEEWSNEERGRMYFSAHPSVKRKSMYMGDDRRDTVKLTRLKFGHCGLASCLKVVGKHQDGLCECGRVETVVHVLFECEKYRAERLQLKEELEGMGISTLDYKTLFSQEKERQSVERRVLAFLHNTDLYQRI